MRLAFYAPMKSPQAGTPSGDRRMARLLLQALRFGGHEVAIASDLRMYEPVGDAARQAALARQGEAEAARLLALYAARPQDRPEAWITYHVYHKAPDVIGPRVSATLDLPYLILEPSAAGKRRNGLWAEGFASAARAIAAADALICLTRHDMAGVAALAGRDRLSLLPPFLDAAPYQQAGARRDRLRAGLAARLDLPREAAWLLAVGMFRHGDKLESYRRLGAALARLGPGPDWRLLVAGDGAAAAEVEAALAALPQPPCFLGRLAEEELPAVYASSDLLVWPAANEAYGMALLESQAAGCPVVSCATRGVPDVVTDGRTGLLVPEGDLDAFAAAIALLLRDPGHRRRLGAQAAAAVAQERSVAAAAAALDTALAAAVRRRAAGGPG